MAEPNGSESSHAAALRKQAEGVKKGSFAESLLTGAAAMADAEMQTPETAAQQIRQETQEGAEPRSILRRLLPRKEPKSAGGEPAPVGRMQQGHAEQTLGSANDAGEHPAFQVRKNLKYSGS